ncbi:MAG: phage tail tube protein [Bryobacteraceae bacterium]
MAVSFSRNERIYLQKEAAFGVIPNTGGTASVSGSNCCRHIKASLMPDVALLVRPDKTGSRTATAGVAGRKTGRWSVEMSLAASGAAGVVPDCDPILAALFGADATVNAGVSVNYALADVIKSFTFWRFRTPAAVMQQVAFGCVVNEATFNLGQDIAQWSASGECIWVPDSVNFASTDTEGKGGLTAFPVEPANPVTNGGIIAGFTGQATFDGNVLANIRTATLKIVTGNAIVKDTFGAYYGTSAEGDLRNVSLSFGVYDDDAAETTNLYQKAISKTPINITLQIGTVTGNKWTFTVNGVQLAVPSLDDGQRRWSATFGDSQASGSSVTALDEVALTIS